MGKHCWFDSSLAHHQRGPGRVVQAAAFQAAEASSILAARSSYLPERCKSALSRPVFRKVGGAFLFLCAT